MVRAFTYGAMGRRIDPLWWTHRVISCSSQCSMTGLTKACGMYYPVCGMMNIKEPLLLIGKSIPCGSSGFPLSLSEWSFTICLMPYNRKYNVLSASLNKTHPSFHSRHHCQASPWIGILFSQFTNVHCICTKVLLKWVF